jgi:hypothetical protein
MEPEDDPRLSKLLREWKVEDAPRSLDNRVLAAGRPWWRVLITKSIRVPAPIAVAFAAAFLAMGGYALRPRTVPPPPAAASAINLVDFHPVADPNVRIIVSRDEAR